MLDPARAPALSVVLMCLAGCASAPAPFATKAAPNPPMVAFFTTPAGTCPEGWRQPEDLRGRMILGTVDPTRVGLTRGQPMRPADEAEARHTHRVATTLWPAGVKRYKLKDGSEGPALLQPYQLVGYVDTAAAEAALPTYQLAACEQTEVDALLDELPKDSVAYYRGSRCPERGHRLRWVPYEAAAGRFAVPLVGLSDGAATVGVPWGARRRAVAHQHQQEVGTPLDFRELTNDGRDCGPLCGERAWMLHSGARVTIKQLGTSHALATPHIELLVCRKAGDIGGMGEVELHPKFTWLSATNACPDRARVAGTRGRFLVGLPERATPNQPFGIALKNREDRVHAHDVEWAVEGLAHQAVWAIGSVGLGIAQSDKHVRFTGTLRPARWDVPYIQLAHCEPRSARKIANPEEPR